MIDWPQHMLAKAIDRHNLTILRRTWDMVPDQLSFFERYLAVANHPDSEKANVFDAFSQGQLDSKMWLCSELSKIQLHIGSVFVQCGWIGVLPMLLLGHDSGFGISKIRSFDIDSRCAEMADTLNRPAVTQQWLFKASTIDVNDMAYENFSYKTVKHDGSEETITDSADTIINTSCDHMGMDSAWWDNIPAGKLVILQNNDFVDVNEHDNTIGSVAEFADMYPMSHLLFSGELDCKLYKRFMLIGRK